MKRFYLIIQLSTLLAVATYAFRPAPPPGSPSFVVDPEVTVGYVYIDAVLLDTIAQVVFFASMNVPDSVDEIEISPNWPVDSVVAFTSMNIMSEEKGIVLRAGETKKIKPRRDFVLRISYEFSVRRTLSGPPGPWKVGEVFALYPPFESIDGEPIVSRNFIARVILPPDMEPVSCADKFEMERLSDGFNVWFYRGDSSSEICRFQSIGE